jgi:hypothetical protein
MALDRLYLKNSCNKRKVLSHALDEEKITSLQLATLGRLPAALEGNGKKYNPSKKALRVLR